MNTRRLPSRFFYLLVVVSLLTMIFGRAAVFALPPGQQEIYTQGINYFDISSSSCGAASFGPGTLPSYVPSPYNGIFTAAGNAYNIDPAVLVGVFYDENYGQTDAVSAFQSHTWPNPPPPYGTGQPWPANYNDNGSGTWPDGTVGARGPFQFEPGTWSSEGVDGNGDGQKDPTDLADAAFGAANYLASLGATNPETQTKIETATHSYSGGYTGGYDQNAWEIFQQIKSDEGASASSGSAGSTATTTSISSDSSDCSSSATQGTVQAAVAAAQQLSNTNLPYPVPDTHYPLTQDPTQTPAYDCSQSVSWVLLKAGFSLPGSATWGSYAPVSGDFTSWGQPGPGQEMTVWAAAGDHVFIEFNVPGLGHYQLNTSVPGHNGPDFAPWGPMGSVDAASGNFTARHWPGT